jgi:hypothetical protein
MQPGQLTVYKVTSKAGGVTCSTVKVGLGLSRLLNIVYDVCRHRLNFISFSPEGAEASANPQPTINRP